MTTPLPGTRIGPYLLTELVGRGGMGEVYRASRADREYHHEVAIKLIRHERFSEPVIRRFQRERQVLARLDHPNIATLLDGGVTETGLPYLVMQYIDGVPITQYADRHGLGLRERLALFRTVAEAVQFAHTNLVVHRDLKPSNILVTADGQPRLLDFGIAKLLVPAALEPADTTTTDLHLLTPQYASPEQFLGQQITTATDVYGLGVLLYEVLTGVRPFQAVSPAELPRAILEREPAPSSSVAPPSGNNGPGVTRPAPDADLDAIVLMALRKEPGRRYASAAQMAEDIQRYLDRRPVLAHPDGWGYRTARFMRRNRLAVAVAAGVALFLGGATIVAARGSRRREVALGQAEAERTRADRLTAFMLRTFKPSDTTGGPDSLVTARELLDRAALRLQRDLSDQPLQRADLEFAIGRAYSTLGMATTSAGLFERVLADRRAHLPPGDPDVGEALEWLGRARAYQGKLPEAAELGREALAIKEAALGPSSPELVPTLTLIARVRNILDSRDTARATLPLLMRALTILGTEPAPNQRDLANVYRTLALRSSNRGEGEPALGFMRAAIAAGRTVVDSNHPFLFNLYEDLATAFWASNQGDSAIAIHRWLLGERERVFGPDHPDVAFSLHNLGTSLSRQGRLEEAIPRYERALAIRERVGGPNHYLVGHSLMGLGVVVGKTGDYGRSERMLKRAVAILSQSLGPRNRITLDARVALARSQVRGGKREAGLTELEAAVAAGVRLAKDDPAFASLAGHPRFQALVAEPATTPP